LPNGYVLQFASQPNTPLFALYNAGTHSHLLISTGAGWKEVTLPVNEIIYSIALHWSDRTIFISTDTAVNQGVQREFTSGDIPSAFTWQNSSENLPVRPHCNHLRTCYDGGRLFLYVSAYGGSICRSEIPLENKPWKTKPVKTVIDL
jgi:hypothetical protein